MKLKVLILILIVTAVVFWLDRKGWLGTKKKVTVTAHYLQYTCGKNNIDMRVLTADASGGHLVGQVISPELKGLDQSSIKQFVQHKTNGFTQGRDSALHSFTLIGYVRQSDQPHCSGAICFKVSKIKYAGDSTFVEFE